MPVHTYTNWNSRPSDHEEQVEPYRKYFFICEGANTETFYFRRLIDLRKQLGIHPLIDIRLWEKTEGDKDISFPKNLLAFAESQKQDKANSFDVERDKMVVVFDGDIFEDKKKLDLLKLPRSSYLLDFHSVILYSAVFSRGG